MDDINGLMIRAIRIISLIVTFATVITMLTPNKTDDAILQQVRNVLNVFAGNILNNTNLDDPKNATEVQETKKILEKLKKYDLPAEKESSKNG